MHSATGEGLQAFGRGLRSVTGCIALGIGVLIAGPAGLAQTPAPPAAVLPPPPPVAYAPSMADLMNIAILPRHAKLGIALRERNLTYSAYEARELRGAFARIVRTIPVFEGKATAELFGIVQAPLQALDDAIKSGDAARIQAGYGVLTDTCNACHSSVGKPYIAIVPPVMTMFPNQDFRRPAAN